MQVFKGTLQEITNLGFIVDGNLLPYDMVAKRKKSLKRNSGSDRIKIELRLTGRFG
jgi:hypothetical protein